MSKEVSVQLPQQVCRVVASIRDTCIVLHHNLVTLMGGEITTRMKRRQASGVEALDAAAVSWFGSVYALI
jgi:hypothetical protein